MKLLALFAVLLVGSSPLRAAESFGGRCAAVLDGDTVKVQKANGQIVKVRLWCADAPEHDQPYGDDAKDFTTCRVQDARLTVIPHGVSYGRIVGEVLIDGKSLGEQLVRKGLAMFDPRYVGKRARAKWQGLQNAAHREALGIWRSTFNPVPPWQWRKQKR